MAEADGVVTVFSRRAEPSCARLGFNIGYLAWAAQARSVDVNLTAKDASVRNKTHEPPLTPKTLASFSSSSVFLLSHS
jgi:hypothetical protein